MIHFTASMKRLVVVCVDMEYTLTGYRYWDDTKYWYETTDDIWLMGCNMRFRNGL